jgi:hypothetical protein
MGMPSGPQSGKIIKKARHPPDLPDLVPPTVFHFRDKESI